MCFFFFKLIIKKIIFKGFQTPPRTYQSSFGNLKNQILPRVHTIPYLLSLKIRKRGLLTERVRMVTFQMVRVAPNKATVARQLTIVTVRKDKKVFVLNN